MAQILDNTIKEDEASIKTGSIPFMCFREGECTDIISPQTPCTAFTVKLLNKQQQKQVVTNTLVRMS